MRPQQKVIVYRAGISGLDRQTYMRKWHENKRSEDEDLTKCDRCGKFYKNPNQSHYADFKNKIRCLPKGTFT